MGHSRIIIQVHWLLLAAVVLASLGGGAAFVPKSRLPRAIPNVAISSSWSTSASQYKQQSLVVLRASGYSNATTAYTSPQSAATIQDLLHFTNIERNSNRLRELAYSKELEKAAQRHAADMAKNNYFSHDGLNGSDLKDRVALTQYRYTNVGENLFWRTPDNDPGYAVQGWMESPGHRKNLLDEQFTEVGLGYAVDEENGKHYYVQVFGRPLLAPNVEGPGPTLDTMIQTVNNARQTQSLPPFQVSNDLNQGAQEHADEMVQKGELVSKLKRGSYDRFFTQLGARFAARELFNDPSGAVQGWLKKGSQSDLLSERFTETGVGYATDGEQHYYVQLFGTPMETGVGRRDTTRPAAPFEPVSGVQPTIKAGDATKIVPRRMPPNQINMPRKKDKQEDNSRNGDFGRMGFGEFNEVRREDSDEVDNSWNDDKRVMAQMRERSGRVRVSRTNKPQRADQSPTNRRPPEAGHSHDEWDDDRRVFERMEEMRYGDMDPSQAKYFGGGRSPQGGTTSSKINANAVGFDDAWNKDYAGTANQLRRVPSNDRSRNNRGGPRYPDDDDYYYDDRRDGPDGYYDDPRYRRSPNRNVDDRPGRGRDRRMPRDRRDDYYDDRDRMPRQGGAPRGQSPRGQGSRGQGPRGQGPRGQGMRDERRDAYDVDRRGRNGMRQGAGGMEPEQRRGGRGRPRKRSNTPGVFGTPNKKKSDESENNRNLKDIHFRRHAEQTYDSEMRGMNRDGGFMYDPREGDYYIRGGGEYYDDRYDEGGDRYGPRGRRPPPRGGYDDYDMPPRRRPPSGYY